MDEWALDVGERMTEQSFSVFWQIMLFAAAVFCILAGLTAFLYYFMLLRRMERMLRHYQNGEPGQELLAETRESKLEAQLRRILRQSRQAQEQAKNDREHLAGLLSDLSHQLKTPLANVLMDAELLQGKALTKSEQEQFSVHIAQQAAKMQWLISALVKSSRLENGIVSFEAGMHSIRKTLAKSVSAVYAQAQARNIYIETELFDDRKLYHNVKWTAEVFTNVLENAVKYSPVGSVVRIRICPMELYTKIDFCDEGPGVPKDECTKIFQRFFRGKAVEQEPGSGLGLYLAQVILTREKGYITCTQNPEGGSCFSVFLLNGAPPGES